MKIANLRLGFCKTCYAVFKVSVDEKTGSWSYERPPKNLTFTVRSPSLNTDLPYTEPLMPDNVRENLAQYVKATRKERVD